MMAIPHISRWWHNTSVHVALIMAVGLIIYSGIYSAPFVYDDFQCIVLNPAITNSGFITDTTTLKNLQLNEDIHKNIVLRPVGYLTFTLNYHLGGFGVVGYHIFNVIVHLLSALLVYMITRLTLVVQAKSAEKSSGTVISFTIMMPLFIALLFVSHPLQTQSVTYITQRFTSLAALFYLLSLAMYIKSGLSRTIVSRYLFYTGSLVATCVAMKTKEIAFTLPLIILVYECIFFSNSLKRRIIRLFPFMLTLLIIPVAVIKLEALFSHATGSSVGQSMNLVNYNGVSRLDYFISEFRVIVTYIRLLLIPINQHLNYDVPVYTSFFQPQVALSFVLIVTILGSGVYLLYRSKTSEEPDKTKFRLIAFGIIWFFVTLSVESTLVPLDDLLVEQRVYLPSVGLIMAFVASVALIFDKRQRTGGIIFAVLCSLIVAALATTAYTRNRLWNDPIALWMDTAKKNPQSRLAYQCIGAHYFGKLMFKESIAAIHAAQRLAPKSLEVSFNLANVYLAINRFDEAEAEYLKAMNIHPNNELLYNSLVKLYIRHNMHSKALPLLQHLLQVYPYSPEVHTKLAELYEAMGQREQAVAEYLIVLRLTPGDLIIINRLKQLAGT